MRFRTAESTQRRRLGIFAPKLIANGIIGCFALHAGALASGPLEASVSGPINLNESATSQINPIEPAHGALPVETGSNSRNEEDRNAASQSGPFPCIVDDDCFADPANNACNCAECTAGFCSYSCTEYGDIDCDGFLGICDAIRVLDGFNNGPVCEDCDISPCGGDGIVNLNDVLAVFSGISGLDPCSCDPGGTAPLCGSMNPPPPPEPAEVESIFASRFTEAAERIPDRSPPAVAGAPTLNCRLRCDRAVPGGSVALDVYVDNASTLQSYDVEIQLMQLSGPGSLSVSCPGGITVGQARTDYVFFGAAAAAYTNCPALRAGATVFPSASWIVDPPHGYLATYLLSVSADATAASVFQIFLQPAPDSSLDCGASAFGVGTPCTLLVDPDGEPDGDGDGIFNVCDNCVSTSNADQADCDGDGMGDACETHSDADGLPDDCDNCPSRENMNQRGLRFRRRRRCLRARSRRRRPGQRLRQLPHSAQSASTGLRRQRRGRRLRVSNQRLQSQWHSR